MRGFWPISRCCKGYVVNKGAVPLRRLCSLSYTAKEQKLQTDSIKFNTVQFFKSGRRFTRLDRLKNWEEETIKTAANKYIC